MLIGLTGYARTGKDTVAQTLVQEFGFVRMAFADGLRDLAAAVDPHVMARINTADEHPVLYSELLREVGYDRAKANPDVRRLLQRMGTEGVRGVLGDSTWRDLVATKIAAAGTADIVITDVRFLNEAKMITELGGVVVRTVRPGFGRQTGHSSETEMETYPEGWVIEADTLAELHEETLRMEHAIRVELQYAADDRAAMSIKPPVNVYIAAPAREALAAQDAHKAFNEAGLPTFSNWSTRVIPEGEPAEAYSRDAQLDMEELLNSDVLVVLNLGMSAGKATELGIALAAGKRIILVGPRAVFGDKGNIFYALPQVEQVATVRDAILALGGFVPTVALVPYVAPEEKK